VANKPGRIEMADNGTLFLDEIGELPLESQVKLLRVIQHGEIERVGASAPKNVNVRIVAATHRNLSAMAEDGTFRQDLFYRLAVVPLELPPLRERRQDVPELLEHLFRQARERHNMPNVRLAPSLLGHFTAYRWPGNIRELENIIERMLVLSNGEVITEDDLPEELRQASLPQQRATLLLELPEEGISLEAVERELLLRALEKFDGNQTHAARYLDISRRTFIYRMEKHGLRQDDLTRPLS
jgi:two-component system NtrC family response regulator